MTPIILSIVGGLALLAVGAEGLVRGSAALALRLGLTPLVIGLTIVAFGTGSPELAVGIEAALQGNSGLALGNVIGSNISNIMLILGLSALARPLQVRSEVIRREVPLMVAVTLFVGLLLLDGALSRLDGALLIIGAVAYPVLAYTLAQRDRNQAVAAQFDEALPEPTRAAWLDAALVVVGLLALLGGARLLLSGAISVAEMLGVSQLVIGLTIVALGTSFPELATSLVAALRGESDVALGNVIGSNILNILAILGVAALVQPFRVEGLRALDMAVFIGSAALLWPLLWRGSVLNRWEGALLVAGYVAYLVSLLG